MQYIVHGIKLFNHKSNRRLPKERRGSLKNRGVGLCEGEYCEIDDGGVL